MTTALEVNVADDGAYVVRGDLDAHSAATFESALASAAGTVVLDLSEVPFADSSGLRVILALHRRLDADDGKLVVRTPSRRVNRLLTVTGLDGVLNRS